MVLITATSRESYGGIIPKSKANSCPIAAYCPAAVLSL
jgi:hypothetical protein